MSVDYISVNNTKVAETACVKREPIPLIVDETYERLCECEAMVNRITEIVKGELPPLLFRNSRREMPDRRGYAKQRVFMPLVGGLGDAAQ